MLNKKGKRLQFPSPYGVIFILTEYKEKCDRLTNYIQVSVSLRSYIHSYLKEMIIEIRELEGFRLLTELYSFLLICY